MYGTRVDPYLEAALACVDMFYARIFRDWPSAVTRTREEYTLSYSGSVRLTGANHLWLHTPNALTEDALEDADRFFAPFQAAWSVIVTDTYMPHAADFLHQRGYYHRWSSPLMVLDGQPQPLPDRPDARVIRATTPQHLDSICVVMSEAFATTDDVNRRVARIAHLDNPDITHYLILVEGEPAASATVARCGTVAGVWNVGTRRRFRRQGYATTIMHAALDDLWTEGCTVTALMASPSGSPLYTRLGYREIGMTHYMGPPRRSHCVG